MSMKMSETLHWDRGNGMISDENGDSVARVVDRDVLSLADEWGDADPGLVVIAPCGSHAGVDPEPSADLLARWSSDSWEPFNEAMVRAGDLAAEHGTEFVVLPGAGGRLSDAVCTVSWSASHSDVGLLLDPVGWLTPSMMRDLEDHLIRFASVCGEMPNIWGVVMRSVRMDDSGALVHAPVGEGLVSGELLERTIGTIPSPRRILSS
ncbi:MAG: hypothetical protein JJ974_10295 [Phycisphaerales bacterium]|nr:hypothetical protein [Phycisphaerales bacterium]